MKKAFFFIQLFFALQAATLVYSQYILPDPCCGKVERHADFQSAFVVPRNIDVWLPDDYDTTKRYSVVYMHDGQMLFDSTTTWNKQEWGVDELAGHLNSQQLTKPFLVVAIWNSVNRHAEYFPQKAFELLSAYQQDSLLSFGKRNTGSQVFSARVQSDDYLRFLVEELKPFIDSHYHTLPGRDDTFIVGSSMGGLISMYAMCEYPDVFGGAACLSTHWPGVFSMENNPVPDAFLTYINSNLPAPDGRKWYFDYGTETLDALYEPTQLQVDTIFYSAGYQPAEYLSLKFTGADHSEKAWRSRLKKPFVFILEKNKKIL